MPDRPPRERIVLVVRDAGRPDDEPFAVRLKAWLKRGLRAYGIRVVSISPQPPPEAKESR